MAIERDGNNIKLTGADLEAYLKIRYPGCGLRYHKVVKFAIGYLTDEEKEEIVTRCGKYFG